MALAWIPGDPRIMSATIGVSSVRQLEENIGALGNRSFTPVSWQRSTDLSARVGDGRRGTGAL